MAKRRKEGFFLRIAALTNFQGNERLFKMGGIKFFESSFPWLFKTSLALTSSVPDFDGHWGGLYRQPLWKEI